MKALVQLGADEAEPLMQPAAVDARCGAEAGLRKTVRDILQDGGVLGQHHAFVGAQRRHQADRIDGAEVRSVLEHRLGRRVDFEIVRLGASLVQRDAGRHRAGERREIKVHL
jgi:hypothetical protein